ncbi:methyltransferase domain-containing protein [Candidatus Skiveiella danica]|uniref:methyltransferase domain-containing protein n=1 Tax=Candidatus Skiveiella danica TaxID=3386177 RepID=UPI0009D3EB44|nr:MAG: ribosomal protein L11 methyltransferase [Alphaproteobacteria bacterium ADurb.Bin100]
MSSLLDEHLGYVADAIRLDLFRSAIAQTLRPGDRVADVGCGSAVLGLLCLQAGAGHIDAIDSTAAIEIARQSLTKAGWGDKANFIHGTSFQAELPESVDVLICDHVGYFGFDYGLIETLADARRRFLKPGGRLIPGRLRLQLGAVESEKCHQLAEGWAAPGIPGQFHWLRQQGINTKYAVNLQADEVLAGPTELGCIDLRADNPEFFSWTAELTVARDGVMHGLAGWFECELAENVWMTNSPLSAQAIKRSQAFLPIDGPLAVKAGELVSATVMARPADRLIAWDVRHPASGRKFSHSTWLGDLLMHEQLNRTRPDHVPQLSRAARARALVLSYCDGQRSVGQIQEAVLREHPALFPSSTEITRFVAAVLTGSTD